MRPAILGGHQTGRVGQGQAAQQIGGGGDAAARAGGTVGGDSVTPQSALTEFRFSGEDFAFEGDQFGAGIQSGFRAQPGSGPPQRRQRVGPPPGLPQSSRLQQPGSLPHGMLVQIGFEFGDGLFRPSLADPRLREHFHCRRT